ncbi:MAG: ABC transporter substrate-binding protein [Pseudomonadota bacterium]
MRPEKEHAYLPTLKSQLAEQRINRREFLRTATLLGLGAPAAYAFAVKVGGAAQAAGSSATTADLPQGGDLKLGMRVMDISSPHTFSWLWDSNVVRQVTDYLTRTGPDNITRPCLVEFWEPSEDLRTWTLTLRQGLKWHNGRDFTADDVVWNLKRVLDPDTGSSVLGLMKGYMLDSGADGRLQLWDAAAVERLDDHRVRLNCKVPQLAVPEHLFHYPLLILDPEEGGSFGPGSNGLGAFELVVHQVGESAFLRARKDYWGRGPFVDSLEFIDLGDDPTGEIQAMAAQRLHGVDIVDISQLEAFKLMPHLRMYEVSTASTAVARGKITEAPFDDPRVRKALRLAIDTRLLQQLVHDERGEPAEHHHVSPAHPEYAPLPFATQDLAQAKALLAEAGHGNGLDLGVIDCIASPSWQFNAVQAMAEMWRAVGVRVRINLLPSTEFWQVWDKTRFGFTGWVHRPLGIMTLGLGYRSGVPWNESGYANPEFDRLLTEAEGLLDVNERREVMAKLQAIMQDDGPIVQPLWRSELTFMDKRIKGFQMHPSTYIFANELALSP